MTEPISKEAKSFIKTTRDGVEIAREILKNHPEDAFSLLKMQTDEMIELIARADGHIHRLSIALEAALSNGQASSVQDSPVPA